MKRFFGVLFLATVLHASLSLGLAALASNRAERERFEGNLPAHAVFRAMGVTAQVLFHPLMWLPRGEVSEPRTTILFAANSFLWGLAIAVVYARVMRYRRRPKVSQAM